MGDGRSDTNGGAGVTGATLELEQLSAGYDRAAVVRELSLAVASGEVVALIGANGAGKTTTLRAISGLVKPMGGQVPLDGVDLAGVSPTARVRKGIVHVPQGRGIFYGLTVSEHFRLDGVREGADLDAAFAHFPALRDLRGRALGVKHAPTLVLDHAPSLRACPRVAEARRGGALGAARGSAGGRPRAPALFVGAELARGADDPAVGVERLHLERVVGLAYRDGGLETGLGRGGDRRPAGAGEHLP